MKRNTAYQKTVNNTRAGRYHSSGLVFVANGTSEENDKMDTTTEEKPGIVFWLFSVLE